MARRDLYVLINLTFQMTLAILGEASTNKASSTSLSTVLVLNTSDAFSSFWVKTVIQVRPDGNDDVYSSAFQTKMERQLAETYNLAMWIRANSRRRKKRAVTYYNATIQITNITREYFANPLDTDLIYYLVQNSNFTTITPAQETVSLINLLGIEQVSSILGYPVTTLAEPYLPDTQSSSSNNLWIIGAVIGGVVGLVFIIWLILFTYIQCTRPPKSRPVSRQVTARSTAMDEDLTERNGKIVPQTFSELTVDSSTQASARVDQATSVRSLSTADKYAQVGEFYGDGADDLYARVVKTPKTTLENGQEKRKKRKKQKRKSDEEDAYAIVEFPLSEIPTESDAQTFQLCESLAPVHTPLFLGTNSNRSKVLWDPYEAADKSAEILTTENEVFPTKNNSPLPEQQGTDTNQNSNGLEDSARFPILRSTELPLAKQSTLNALRAANLLPSEDYTSVVLDTVTFRPRQRPRVKETSVDATTLDVGSARPSVVTRPAWSTVDETEPEQDGQKSAERSSQKARKPPKYFHGEAPPGDRSWRNDFGGGEYFSNA